MVYSWVLRNILIKLIKFIPTSKFPTICKSISVKSKSKMFLFRTPFRIPPTKYIHPYSFVTDFENLGMVLSIFITSKDYYFSILARSSKNKFVPSYSK